MLPPRRLSTFATFGDQEVADFCLHTPLWCRKETNYRSPGWGM